MPERRAASPLGQHLFDQRPREDTGELPRGKDQCSQGPGTCKRVVQSWYRRIGVAYVVLEAWPRADISFWNVLWGFQKHIVLSVLCLPSPSMKPLLSSPTE
jgi:hypothetical protein